MCGFCGVYAPDLAPDDARRWIAWGADRMIARGPDDAGHYHTDSLGVHLGFRRLAVLDPSPAGHQPMEADDGSSVLMLNGEVYNFQELRRDLERRGHQFRSSTDTEVVLELLRARGADGVAELNGMFALAWFDRAKRRLLLARDHAGIKPLFYAWSSDRRNLAFASQYDVVARPPWPAGDVDPEVLSLYLRLHHVPPPFGLLERTGQLDPGELMEIGGDGVERRRRWWQLTAGDAPMLRDTEVGDAFDEALHAAVSRQMVADRPLGTFLSGGIDSPLVTAEATSARSTGALDAFTVGIPGWGGDESADACAFGRALEVRHHLLEVDDRTVVSAFESVIEHHHEPSGDFSILPTTMVSALAAQSMVVALSGDGGDELFYGYERPWSLLRNHTLFRLPLPLRRGRLAAGRLPGLARVSDAVAHRDPGAYYFAVNSRTPAALLASVAPGATALPTTFDLYRFHGSPTFAALADFARRAEFYGQLQRVLRKVDLASMAHSLEVRVPLLDREIIDLSLRIDPAFNLRGGVRKGALVDALARRLPGTPRSAVKRGFGAPVDQWLRGVLKERVEETLASDLYPDNYFDTSAVRALWKRELRGDVDAKWPLWTVLSLQWWAERVGLR